MSQQSFDADVTQLIQLVTHSIYSSKEVFLRELIANASDAIQKAKIEAAKNAWYLGDETDLHITISIDTEKNIIELTDTGIGMNTQEVTENIGTIAKSGTKVFLEQLKAQKDQSSDLIGQFGIGFYSAFMVADTVELETKKMWQEAVLWKSEGKWTYEITPSDKSTRGTTIRLYLNEDAKEYANHGTIKNLVKKHANYVPVAIMMHELNDKGETQDTWEQVNAMKSLWTKQKSEVTKEEYKEFYTSLTFDQADQLDTIHVSIEWAINFKALLFLPKHPPAFGHLDPEKEYGPTLYVQNVMIMENAKELLPSWLRFVKWVVETPDLSLNVSRELIQSNTLLAKIQKTLVKEIMKSLKWLMTSEPENYLEFYEHYNRYLKEWVHFDRENKEQIAGMLMYPTRLSEKKMTLDAVVENIAKIEKPKSKSTESNTKENNENEWEEKDEEKTPIYYLTWPNLDQLKTSPYLEQFEWTDHDIVLMADPIDEWVVQWLLAYKDYPLKNAMHADLSENDESASPEKKKALEKQQEENKDFLAYIKETVWTDLLEEVRLSSKMKSSIAMLTAKDWQTSAQMERIMQAMGQEMAKWKRTLELNAGNVLVQNVMKQYATSWKTDKMNDLVQYLYEQAVLLEWWQVDDINAFLKRANWLVWL